MTFKSIFCVICFLFLGNIMFSQNSKSANLSEPVPEPEIMWQTVLGVLQQNLPRNCATQTRLILVILKGTGITTYETLYGIPEAEELFISFLNWWVLSYTSQTKDSYSWFRCDEERRAAVTLRKPFNTVVFVVTASRDKYTEQLVCTLAVKLIFTGKDGEDVTRKDQCFEINKFGNNEELIKKALDSSMIEVGASVPSDGTGGVCKYDLVNIVQMDIMTIEEHYYANGIIPDIVNLTPGKKK